MAVEETDQQALSVTTKTTKNQNWLAQHKLASVVIFVVIFIIIASNSDKAPASNTTNTQQSVAVSAVASAKPTRKTTGVATSLGAGSFTGGKDVATGLYDVTPGDGQSGNFYVSGIDSTNEVLGVSDGMGVPTVRTKISDGDKIEISSLSQVNFTPVTAPFVTSYTTTTLGAGIFRVGEDIGAGRYVATPGAGQTGNLNVTGQNNVNEVLGVSDGMGVPNVTTSLSDGDSIEISSLSQVIFTPTK